MLRRHSLILGLLLILGLAATWPLFNPLHGAAGATLPTIGAFVPGSDTWAHDEYTFIWSMWWFKHSLLDLHSSIFFSPDIFYPLGMELILYSYNLMAAILALPLGLAANWALAANVSLLFSIVVSGFGAYLLALWTLKAGGLLSDRSGAAGRSGAFAAFVAAVIYAFASNRAIYLALGHYNIHSVHFLPFFALYLLRVIKQPNRHNSVMLGLFGAFNLLVDMQYGVFMAFLAGCLLLAKSLRPLLFARGGRPESTPRAQALRRWLALALAGALTLLLTLPYFWQTVKAVANSDFLLSGWGDALKLSADLVGWLTPTALHPVWGADWPTTLRAVQEGTGPFSDVNTVFLGYATLALALVGAGAAWRRARGWVIAAIISALFTLGPLLQIRGRYLFNFDGLETSVPLPFLLLHYLPFVQGNRAANRWSIVLMLSLAILAAWGVASLWRWLQTRATTPSSNRRTTWLAGPLSLLLVGLILFEHAAVPLPLTDARIPPAIQQLAALPAGAVLQIPMGWRNSFGTLGAEDTRAQYYMAAHGKPILSGNTSRNPPIKFDYFSRLPLVQALTQQESGQPPDADTLSAARDQVDELLALWGVRYLLLLPAVAGRLPYADTWQSSQELALDLIPHNSDELLDDGQVRVYGVEPGPPLPLDLDFGGRVTDAWRGEGWSVDEADVGGASGIWATDRRNQLLFRSNDATGRRLSFRATPFTWPNAAPQQLRVVLNGQTVGEVEMAGGWQEYSFEITPRPGINHLWLEFSRADSPRTVLEQATIGSTGVQSPVNIEVHSFDQAYITLTGTDGEPTPASAGRRGYNVTVIDEKNGRVLDQQGFDTVANEYEVQRLAEYLQGLPDGRVVILATREGAGEAITPDLIAALRRLGSGVADPAALAGQAHALVGVVKAPPGTAAEVVDPADAFLRIDGDFRTLAAAFDWLRID